MKANLWGIIILFLVIVFYFGYAYNWQLPVVFWSDSTETNALIIDSKMVLARNGSKGGRQQRISFAYEVGDSVFIKTKQISATKGFRPIGSKLKLSYENSDPEHFRIEAYYKPKSSEMQRRYYWSNRNYRHAYIYLQNGILKWEEFGKKGVLISSNYYRVSTNHDTLTLSGLMQDETFAKFHDQVYGLREIKTQRFFKFLKK